MKVLIYFQPIY